MVESRRVVPVQRPDRIFGVLQAACIDDAEKYPAWASRNQLIAARQEIESLAVTLEEMRLEIKSRAKEAERLRAARAALQERVDDLLGSTSWRVTRPLRQLGRNRRH
jgi:hypothetical protein